MELEPKPIKYDPVDEVVLSGLQKAVADRLITQEDADVQFESYITHRFQTPIVKELPKRNDV